MGHYLDIEAWERRAQYEFFRTFEHPFFGMCSTVDITATLAWTRANKRSFALAAWFACQQTVNALQPFRLRIREDGVWVHDEIAVATTILNDDQTFRFVYLPYTNAFDEFERLARETMAGPPPETINDQPDNDAVVHGSTVPWVEFSSITHARPGNRSDSIPKFVFGKYSSREGEYRMPVAVDAHHALMDGFHVGQFYQKFSELLAEPEMTFGPKMA